MIKKILNFICWENFDHYTLQNAMQCPNMRVVSHVSRSKRRESISSAYVGENNLDNIIETTKR